MTDSATLERSFQRSARSHWWAMPVLMIGTVMIILDFFVVNVALPSVKRDLHASSTALEWVVAGYGLTFAVLLVSAGRLADKLGRRRMFSLGLAIFAAASLACGLAPDVAVLIGARVVLGVGAALISPAVLSLMGVLYTGAERVRAISIYGMVMGLAAAGGQLVGGTLVQANLVGLGWRTIFLINLPLAAVALVLSPRFVPESRSESSSRLDLTGVLLVTAGLVALVLPLVQGRQLGWPAWTWVCLTMAPVLLGAFALHQRWLERRGGDPVMAPSIFRSPSLRAGLLTQLGFWCGQAALFLVLALYLQEGRGLDPLHAGLVFTILAVAYLATSFRAPALTLRYGRDLIAAGALLLAAGEGLMALAITLNGSFTVLAAGLVVAGGGMGLCITPLTTVVMAHAEPERAGALSGALSTMQQVGNALGVAITGAVFFGQASDGVPHAFALSAVELTCLLVVVSLLTRSIPSIRRSA